MWHFYQRTCPTGTGALEHFSVTRILLRVYITVQQDIIVHDNPKLGTITLQVLPGVRRG